MAISVGLRNRLVGFTIVAATLLIFLPVILSKDMIKRPNPDAIAVNEQGAVLDSSGNLVHQGQPDTQRALNMGQRGELTLSSVNTAQGSTFPRYRIYFGVGRPAGKMRNGRKRVTAVPRTTIAIVMICCVSVISLLLLSPSSAASRSAPQGSPAWPE